MSVSVRSICADEKGDRLVALHPLAVRTAASRGLARGRLPVQGQYAARAGGAEVVVPKTEPPPNRIAEGTACKPARQPRVSTEARGSELWRNHTLDQKAASPRPRRLNSLGDPTSAPQAPDQPAALCNSPPKRGKRGRQPFAAAPGMVPSCSCRRRSGGVVRRSGR